MNTSKAGSGNYQNLGVGNSSSHSLSATIKGKYPTPPGGHTSQGETPGAGSIYSAQLNERPNISNTRNRGPERSPSIAGAKSMPIVTASQRNTGKI